MSALFSFLGGSVFRMIWGEVSHWLTARQEHSHELERMKIQGELDAAAHARNLEGIKLQSELGIKTIEVQSAADLGKLEIGAWAQAVADVGKQTGIKFIDLWNGAIRPALATVAMLAVIIEVILHGGVLNDWDRELIGAILGIYVADRALLKRGK